MGVEAFKPPRQKGERVGGSVKKLTAETIRWDQRRRGVVFGTAKDAQEGKPTKKAKGGPVGNPQLGTKTASIDE
jgi:hypothetical protein